MPALVNLVSNLLTLYGYLLLARILISWIRVDYFNPWVRLLVKLTEPFLAPFRTLVPPLGGVDFSPVLAFFVLHMIRRVLIWLLLGL